jgi:protoheme IX farnesyltransferase
VKPPSDLVIEHGMLLLIRRIQTYLELMKPELTGLSVLTAVCGAYLASSGAVDVSILLWTALGTTCVGGGAGALNQYFERQYDEQMKRTEKRPLPSRRLTPRSAFFFGMIVSMLGVIVLLVATNLLAAALAIATWILYLFLYTPMKRLTPWATVVGGVPGALPPMIGWAAVEGSLSPGAWVLFAILFFWQMPHFYSLAWMYRKDYARAGFRLLPAIDEQGFTTALHIILHCLALVVASVTLVLVQSVGTMYVVIAFVLGLSFLTYALLFAKSSVQHTSDGRLKLNYYSRRLFFASLIYLPVLMGAMIIDKA